ncbi:MAG: hypothetical protein PHW95_01370 [Patescibacteria group bacterium]|nr:hypothetical protein [Patescibacteria group bacterium]
MRIVRSATLLALVIGLAGCPPVHPIFIWGAGLFATDGGCENNFSVFVTNNNAAEASFQLWQQNSQGQWLPTQDQHKVQFGPVENVTLYRVDATYQGQDVFYWNGAYIYSPYGYPYHYKSNDKDANGEKVLPGYYPWNYVPWGWVQSHGVYGHTTETVEVSHMDIIHSEGFDLYSVFPNLSSSPYRVKITGVDTDGKAFVAATTDVYSVVDDCTANGGPCGTPSLRIDRTPLFGDNNGVVSGTVCLENPVGWTVGVYAHVTNVWPDPYNLIGVVPINASGNWTQQGVQTADDKFAIEFFASLAPTGTVYPSTSQGIPQIAGQVDSDVKQRTPFVVFVGNPSVSGGAECQTNYFPALFGAIAYVQQANGNVHQQPMYSPPSASTLVSLIPDAGGAFCTFHIALNQVAAGSSYDPGQAATVKVQVIPQGYNYVKTETGITVDNLNLNLTPEGVAGRGADVAATLAP